MGEDWAGFRRLYGEASCREALRERRHNLRYEKIDLGAGWRVDSWDPEHKQGSHFGGSH